MIGEPRDLPGADPDASPAEVALMQRVARALRPVELSEPQLSDVRLRVLKRAREYAAGGTIRRHQHRQDEEFIVLEGECHIGELRLAAGDMQVAVAGSWHEQFTTEAGTLVLVCGEYPAPEAVRAMRRSGAP
jgi:quercetin dioxygenase-like cupin family protein